MCVSDDFPTVQRLRGGIIGRVGIGEGTSNEIRNLYVDGEILVGCNGIAGTGIGDDCGDHVLTGRDVTHH